MKNTSKKRKRKLSKKKLSVIAVISVVLITGFLNGKEEEKDVLATKNVATNKEEVVNSDANVKKKEKFKVVIDASFGGNDGGSKGYNGIIQKDVNLGIALKMRDILKRHEDIEVILTRDKDTTVSMQERIDIINSSNADLLLSIMQNNEGSGNVKGVESYVLPKEHKMSNTKFGYTVQQAMAMYLNTNDRGVLVKNLDILSKSNVQGAVVNTGFISNKEEGTNLSSDKYQLRVAEGLSQGILSYIDRHLKEQ